MAQLFAAQQSNISFDSIDTLPTLQKTVSPYAEIALLQQGMSLFYKNL